MLCADSDYLTCWKKEGKLYKYVGKLILWKIYKYEYKGIVFVGQITPWESDKKDLNG